VFEFAFVLSQSDRRFVVFALYIFVLNWNSWNMSDEAYHSHREERIHNVYQT
jgi:hypothetical protein